MNPMTTEQRKISDLNDTEIKAFIYDQSVILGNAQNVINALKGELDRRAAAQKQNQESADKPATSEQG